MASTRHSTPCQSPAMKNGRCRMHGGRSPGAPKGNRNAWRHGIYSAEWVAERALFASMARASRELICSPASDENDIAVNFS
ncbi:HGGxSTG domain-containing protein [Sandarakinorhabdus glacialis]|uniref:HGGxSTG domain-containing protein n=1 Tax=Sandarakinorhabdus glacialis TaxID=1614636 RepID=UPI0035309686